LEQAQVDCPLDGLRARRHPELRAPLADFGRKNWGASTIEYRLEGRWQAV
jgi:hypothetical protein